MKARHKKAMKLSSVLLVLVISNMVLDAAEAMEEKNLFRRHCATCHGQDGKGEASIAKMYKLKQEAVDIVDAETLKKSDEEIFNSIKNGLGKMKPFANKLSDKEISGLVHYVRSLGPQSQKGVHGAATLYKANCASCHGGDARGKLAIAKLFKVERAAVDITDKATLEKSDEDLIAVIRDGSGRMKSYGQELSQDEMASLVQYVRFLAPATAASAKAKGKNLVKLFEARCATCHGKDARGKAEISGMYKREKEALDLLDQETLKKSDEDLFRAVKEGAGKMKPFSEKLPDEDIVGLVQYIRSIASK